jgi:AcrR family transcriptional regulator
MDKVGAVGAPVKRRRRYDNARREEQAAKTRHAILTAARELFVQKGYARTTVAQVAHRAGVNIDTVYASVGRKPALMRELVETAISGREEAVPAEEREYVQRMRASSSAREQLEIYAEAIVEIQRRLGPTFLALRDAAATDEDCRSLWLSISERRSANMRLMAAGMRRTGELRADLTDAQVADIIWSMNAAEYWDLLVTQRGWSPAEFRDWLVDAWTRLLLADHLTR